VLYNKRPSITSKYTLLSSKSIVGFQIPFNKTSYFEFFLKLYNWILIFPIQVIEIAHNMSEALKNTNVHKIYLGPIGLKVLGYNQTTTTCNANKLEQFN
jgi:hypothetical protein